MIDEEGGMTSAAIPGTGQGRAGQPANYGDTIVGPAAAKRWKKANETGQGILRRRQPNFAGGAVFEVSSAVFHEAKLQKRKGKHWKTYLGEDDALAEIREFANKNPKTPIILQNQVTGEMCYARYGKQR